MRSCGMNCFTSTISSKERARNHNSCGVICTTATKIPGSVALVHPQAAPQTPSRAHEEKTGGAHDRRARTSSPTRLRSDPPRKGGRGAGAPAGVLELVDGLVEHLQLFLLLFLKNPVQRPWGHEVQPAGGPTPAHGLERPAPRPELPCSSTAGSRPICGAGASRICTTGTKSTTSLNPFLWSSNLRQRCWTHPGGKHFFVVA